MQTGNELMVLVSQNVRRLRVKAGMTVEQAAARGSVHPRTWQRAEAGHNLRLEALAALSVALDVDVTVLFRPAPRVRRRAA